MSEILGPSRLGRETVQRAILWLPDANDIGTVGAAWRLSTEPYGLQPTGLIVGVKQLPRDALVEAQLLYSIGMESGDSDPDENESLTQTRGKHRKERGTVWSTCWEDEYYQVGWEVSASDGTSCALVTFKRKPGNNSDLQGALQYLLDQPELQNSFSETISILAFYTANAPQTIIPGIAGILFKPPAPITGVPARFLTTTDSREWDVAFCTMCM